MVYHILNKLLIVVAEHNSNAVYKCPQLAIKMFLCPPVNGILKRRKVTSLFCEYGSPATFPVKR